MQIRHHIHYLDRGEDCYRAELRFDPPYDVGVMLGAIDQIYPKDLGHHPSAQAVDVDYVLSVVSANGVLHVVEPVDKASVVSVTIRQGHTVQDLVVRESDEVILLAGTKCLVLWVVAGNPGILAVKALVVPDKDGTHSKIRRNIGDLPLQEYLTRKLLHKPEDEDLAVTRWPDVLKTREASAYLRIGDSTLRQKVAEGLIRRTASKKFLKVDLDAYLAGIRKR
ncbi:MAG: helix-turn-helix domain-containing protein [bacterium]|nr:helix-turn-helix domain-containing protein [bacterium]